MSSKCYGPSRKNWKTKECPSGKKWKTEKYPQKELRSFSKDSEKLKNIVKKEEHWKTDKCLRNAFMPNHAEDVS